MRSLLAVVAAIASAACVAAVPEQVHIALAGNMAGRSNGMSVSWIDSDSTAPVVQFGLSPDALKTTVTATTSTYLDTHSHHSSMNYLDPSTRYYYRVGDLNTGAYTKVFSFMSSPAVGSTAPVKALVYGDMGVFNSKNSMSLVDSLFPAHDLVWHIGDIAYADDALVHYPTEFHYEKTYNQYMNAMENTTANIPYMTLPGNHEAECHSPACILNSTLRDGLANFTAYRSRFMNPWKESGGSDNMWYSFNYGPISFISINTETDFPLCPGDGYVHFTGRFGDQMGWLEKALAAANASRSERPWILVAGHRPIYTLSSCDDNGEPTKAPHHLQNAIEEKLHRYGVDVYFAGHVHSGERSLPVYKNQVDPNGYNNPRFPVHIISGAAGNTEGLWHYGSKTTEWSAFHDGEHFAIGSMTVHNRTTLTWEYLNAADGSVLDSMTLTKQH